MGSGRVLCPSAAQRLECGAARIDGGTGKVLFNAQQLVVLSHAVRAAHRAGLDLTRIETHGNIAIVLSSVSPERCEMTAV